MAEILVTAAQLTAKAGELRQLNSSFETQVGQLVSSEQNVCSMWEGDAKTAFDNAFQHDKSMMDEFKKAIDQYATALETIAKEYEKAETQNTTTATNRSYH